MAKITRAQRAKKPSVRTLPKKSANKAEASLARATKTSPNALKKPLKKPPKAKAPKPEALKPKATKPWTEAEVREAFSRFQKANPEPKGELEHLNPYTLLVAVVLSAQATDAGVNRATRALFAVADTPQKMIALGEERLRDYIKTIGLYRTKAKNVIALSKMLIADFGGEVPRTRAEKVIPPEFMLHAHHWLILHGRYTCLARKPRCQLCLINDLCRWPEKTV